MKIWNKIKANKKVIFGIFIFLIITVVGIPIMINKLLYIPIATHSTLDSDWLSFWGSFLGGIIGGIGTLLGVLLTLDKGNKDKKAEKIKEIEERKPRLIPIKKQFYLDYKNKRSILLNKYEEVYENHLTSMIPEVRIVNASKESAIEIVMEWITPKKESIDNCEYLNSEEKELIKELLSKFILKDKATKDIEFIASLGQEISSIHIKLMFYMEKVSDILIKYFVDNNGVLCVVQDVPMGELILECKNVYGETAANRYKI